MRDHYLKTELALIAASVFGALVFMPPFAPLAFSSTFVFAQIVGATFAAVLIGLAAPTITERAFAITFLVGIALPITAVLDLVSARLPLYAWLIAVTTDPPCQAAPIGGKACVLATECTRRDNYLVIKGRDSLEIVQKAAARWDAEHNPHLHVTALGEDRFYIRAGTDPIGMLSDYPSPMFACGPSKTLNPLFGSFESMTR